MVARVEVQEFNESQIPLPQWSLSQVPAFSAQVMSVSRPTRPSPSGSSPDLFGLGTTSQGVTLLSLQLCGNSEYGRLSSLAMLCFIFFSVSIIYLCYFRRGLERGSALSCFVIDDAGGRKRYLLSRNNGCFEMLEQKWQKEKMLPLTGPTVCCSFSVLSVHKSMCSLMVLVCKRLWSPVKLFVLGCSHQLWY